MLSKFQEAPSGNKGSYTGMPAGDTVFPRLSLRKAGEMQQQQGDVRDSVAMALSF